MIPSALWMILQWGATRSLSPSERAAIDRMILDNREGLHAPDPKVRRRARLRLLALLFHALRDWADGNDTPSLATSAEGVVDQVDSEEDGPHIVQVVLAGSTTPPPEGADITLTWSPS